MSILVHLFNSAIGTLARGRRCARSHAWFFKCAPFELTPYIPPALSPNWLPLISLIQHYKKSITTSFDNFPGANFLVILEEDLDVSVDILSYFKQLLPVYENDDSVYCISAWNDQV